MIGPPRSQQPRAQRHEIVAPDDFENPESTAGEILSLAKSAKINPSRLVLLAGLGSLYGATSAQLRTKLNELISFVETCLSAANFGRVAFAGSSMPKTVVDVPEDARPGGGGQGQPARRASAIQCANVVISSPSSGASVRAPSQSVTCSPLTEQVRADVEVVEEGEVRPTAERVARWVGRARRALRAWAGFMARGEGGLDVAAAVRVPG